MKRQIRRGTFETNSSSMHVIVMCMESDYDKWENEGLMLYMGWEFGYPDDNKPNKGRFYTRDEAIAFQKINKYQEDVDWNNKETVDKILHENEWFDYDYFWNKYCDYYETYEETMTTPSGDMIVAFGYYGHD